MFKFLNWVIGKILNQYYWSKISFSSWDGTSYIKGSVGVTIPRPDLVNIYDWKTTFIDPGTMIGPFVEIQKNVSIGRNCKISSHSFICGHVNIGDNCFIGHGVKFINDKLPKACSEDGSTKRDGDWEPIGTIIGDNVSIGTNATIMCGVFIGSNSIIGAGAVVTKSIPENQVWCGNPAKFLKKVSNL